jgi:hypothetical protein
MVRNPAVNKNQPLNVLNGLDISSQHRTILAFCGIALRDATDRESSRYLCRHGAIC